MQTTNRPNQDALRQAVDIYRDAMRPFIVRQLKRVRGASVEELIGRRLGDRQADEFYRRLSENKDIESAIDLNYFPKVIRDNWRAVFAQQFNGDLTVQSTLWLIKTARDQIAHPGTQDIEAEYTRVHLYHIADLLGRINALDEKQAVETIRDNLCASSESVGQTGPIFRLNVEDDNLHSAELVIAKKTDIELENHLESWLENSPWALVEGEPILWIGRQTSANVGERTIFLDLLGLDSEGNLVIVELKKSKAPRDVVAQLLEYAGWAEKLAEEQIREIAEDYYRTSKKETTFQDTFSETFDSEMFENEMPALNRRLRLFVVAEEIPDSVLRVCRFLQTSHGMDINCLTVSTFQTESGEVLVNTEAKVGQEDAGAPKSARQATLQTSRWSGDKPVREVVLETVQELTGGDINVEFAPKEVSTLISKKYPDFKLSNVGPELTAGSPNHSSYHHYSGNHKYYWWVRPGIYRLYDSERDKVET